MTENIQKQTKDPLFLKIQLSRLAMFMIITIKDMMTKFLNLDFRLEEICLCLTEEMISHHLGEGYLQVVEDYHHLAEEFLHQDVDCLHLVEECPRLGEECLHLGEGFHLVEECPHPRENCLRLDAECPHLGEECLLVSSSTFHLL